jgi:hypothetical protein
MKPPDQNRRAEHRLPIKLPIAVIGQCEESWSEEALTEDVSAQGLLCYLTHNVSLGEQLRLKAHLHNGSAIELAGRVAHLVSISENQNRVGVEVVGDSRQWEQYFL